MRNARAGDYARIGDRSVHDSSLLPKPLFEGITPHTVMPTAGPLIIKEIIEGNKIELMFPGGKSLVPTYGAGIPFGVEGPVMETKIRLEKERDQER